MGCDIHAAIEVKKDGKWTAFKEKIFKYAWYDPDSDYAPFREQFTSTPYAERNYDTFAILANVRSGHGFAGCLTGDGFEPISDPRGLPDDVDPETARDSDGYQYF